MNASPRFSTVDADGDTLILTPSDSVAHPHTVAYLRTTSHGVWLTREEALKAAKVLAELAGGQIASLDLPPVTVYHDGGPGAAPLYVSGGTLRRPGESRAAATALIDEADRAREVLAIERVLLGDALK